MAGVAAEQAVFLSTVPARPKDRRAAVAVVVVSVLIFLGLAPFAKRPLPEIWAFMPIYESALAISDLITAAILFIQFNILRSRALLALVCGYLFTALMAVSHALTFPRLFAPAGLLGAGPQSTAWLYLFWHAGFPLAIIAGALLKGRNGAAAPPGRHAPLLWIGAAVGAAVGLTLLATVGKAMLPDIMMGDKAAAALTAAVALVWTLTLAALLLLWLRRPHTVLDLWLMVVMCAWLLDVALSAILNAGRFDLGFYAGRAYGLLAATFVLLMLLRETGTLYAELAKLFEAEHQERQRQFEGRRRTQAALEWHADRERLFSAAVQSSVDAIVTANLDGIITGWNPAAERLFGFGAKEAVGNSVFIIVPEDRRGEAETALARIRRGEIVEPYQTVRLTKDRKPIDVSISVSAIRSDAVIGLCAIARDVTEQKLAEEKFKLAVEACPNGMVMADHIGRIVMVNAEVERLFGYRGQELIDQPIDVLLPERLRAQHARLRVQYGAKPAPRHMGAGRHFIAVRKDGSEFPVEVGLNPIQTRRGLLVLGVIVDISERQRLDRLKDEFVSTVSHELRTPLTSISASLDLLIGKTAGELPERARHLVRLAQSNSKRLVKLVNDILDIEKLKSGQLTFKFRLVELRPLIEQTVEANLGLAESSRVRLCHDIRAEGDVWADPDRLAQVLTNLISNAIKFSPPDGEVVVAAERHGDSLRISVRDHGEGVPAEFKPRMFQKFAQADGTNAKRTGGTGLGLSIVKEIVGRLGGEVSFADAAGGGTIFYVELPWGEQSRSAETAPPRALRDIA